LAEPNLFGGGERDRTDDLLLAKQALSQLSYTPTGKFISQIFELKANSEKFKKMTKKSLS
jgi:hypothetical protein